MCIALGASIGASIVQCAMCSAYVWTTFTCVGTCPMCIIYMMNTYMYNNYKCKAIVCMCLQFIYSHCAFVPVYL